MTMRTEKHLCKDCDYITVGYNEKIICNLHNKRTGLLDNPCDDFKLRKYILIDYCGEESVKNTMTGVVYTGEGVVQRLNDLEHDVIKYQKAFLRDGEKRHLRLQQTLAAYASMYPRNSPEFELICNIGKDLGVTISLFGASDDD